MITLILGLAIGLVLTELALRIRHWGEEYSGPEIEETRRRLRPTVEPDSVVGWKSREGSYVFPPFCEGAPEIRVTILADGRRRTEATPQPSGRPIVAIVGCSYTHGAYISDDDTYAWKLQEQFPDLEFRNYGTPAYSNYQSLLTLERLFRTPEAERPALVLHGYVWFHPGRNVAASSWIRGLTGAGKGGQKMFVGVPYATIDGAGKLRRRAPDHYRALPLGGRLRTAALLEFAYNRLRARAREKQMQEVTDAILVEMRDLCRRNVAGFVNIILNSDDNTKACSIGFCRREGIDVADCSRFPIGPEWTVPGEARHPNGELNGIWAEEIGRTVGDRLRALTACQVASQAG